MTSDCNKHESCYQKPMTSLQFHQHLSKPNISKTTCWMPMPKEFPRIKCTPISVPNLVAEVSEIIDLVSMQLTCALQQLPLCFWFDQDQMTKKTFEPTPGNSKNNVQINRTIDNTKTDNNPDYRSVQLGICCLIRTYKHNRQKTALPDLIIILGLVTINLILKLNFWKLND